MSPNVQLLIEFLEIQLQHGQSNGQLVATHRSLEHFGIPYSTIKSTLDEAAKLGLIEITGEKRGSPTTYRLIK